MLMMLLLGLAEMPFSATKVSSVFSRLLMLMMLLLDLTEVPCEVSGCSCCCWALPKCPSALLKHLPFFQSGPKIGAEGLLVLMMLLLDLAEVPFSATKASSVLPKITLIRYIVGIIFVATL